MAIGIRNFFYKKTKKNFLGIEGTILQGGRGGGTDQKRDRGGSYFLNRQKNKNRPFSYRGVFAAFVRVLFKVKKWGFYISGPFFACPLFKKNLTHKAYDLN